MKASAMAKRLNMSTSALRHYENWGIIPPVPRLKNGYRAYGDAHFAYLTCIRAMLPGFGMDLVKEAMKLVQEGHLMPVLDLVGESQTRLLENLKMTKETIRLLETGNFQGEELIRKRQFTIGEVANLAKVTPTAIRYWEKEGLIHLPKSPSSGYRMFSEGHLRQILFIRSLKHTLYYLAPIKSIVQQLEHSNPETLKNAAEHTLHVFYQQHFDQLAGIHALYELMQAEGMKELEGSRS